MPDTIETEAVLDSQSIKKRSIRGVFTLTSRTFVLQIISLVATFILTILLTPESFGIFFVVTAVVNFLNYFSDVGLAGALIQKKEEPTEVDLASTFTVQQILVLSAVVLMLVFSGSIAQFYHLGTNGMFLLRALVISFLLSSLKTIPSVLLERKLEFYKLVVPQIVETSLFYIVAIFLAFRGYGVASFGWAALARGVSGVVTLYWMVPWKPRILIDKQSLKSLLSFGLPYQANSFLALVKDDLMTAYLGVVLPFAQVGYIGWAKKWAEMGLRLIMDNVIKVTFPAFSRLQHDPPLLAKAIEKSLVFLALLTFPIAIGMVFVIKPFVEIVPRYIKWEPALMSFYLFTISSVLAALSSPLVNALNALGKVKYTFYLMVMWTVLTWVLIPPSVKMFGFNGVALVATGIGLTSFVPIWFIKKVVIFEFFNSIFKPIGATVGMVFVLVIITFFHLPPLWHILSSIIFGMGSYVVLIYVFMGQELTPYLKLLKR